MDFSAFMDGKPKIVRSYSAGVMFGVVESFEINQSGERGTAILTDARRLWYWDGASSLSQLAASGTKSPSTCKFPASVARIVFGEVIEILECSEEAIASIKGVPVWQR